MNLSDIVLFSWKNIKSRRLRSYLTMLGIIIGIVAIISLIMLGEGLERGMTENFDKLGARRLFIGPKNMNPGGPPTGVSRLSNSDVDVVRKLTMVEYTTKVYFDTVNIKYQRKSEVARVGAFDTQNVKKFFDDVDIELEEGKWFETDKNVVVVGWGIAHKLFDKELRLRNAITLDGKKFRVVGIKERQGDRNSDYQIHIPLKAMQELKGKPEAFTSFSAMIKQNIDVNDAEKAIAKRLERKRGDENFTITSPLKIKEQIQGILGVLNIVLIGIAGISLIVGGVGIMNSMYTSVLERTRDIGVMKAIGATNDHIVGVFLFESGFFGLISGFVGVLIGIGIAFGFAALVGLSGAVKIAIEINPKLVVFAIMFSCIVGVLSGTLPAIRAAQLKPVDALRYE